MFCDEVVVSPESSVVALLWAAAPIISPRFSLLNLANEALISSLSSSFPFLIPIETDKPSLSTSLIKLWSTYKIPKLSGEMFTIASQTGSSAGIAKETPWSTSIAAKG